MGDSDKKLKIDIITTADNAGARSAADGLNKVKAAASETAGAQDKMAESGHEAAEGAEKLEINHRLLVKTLGLAGEKARELGHAVLALGEGPVGAAFIIGLAIRELVEILGQADEAARKLRDEQTELTTATWEAQMSAANNAATAAQGYVDKLTAIATQTDKVKQAEDLELAVLRAKKDAQQKILDAQEKADLAAAGDDKFKQEQIKAAYEGRKSAASLSGESGAINTAGMQRSQRMMDSDGLKAASDQAQKNFEAASQDAEASTKKAELDQITKKQAELDKKAGAFDLDHLNKQLADASDTPNEFGESEASIVRAKIETAQDAQKEADENRAKIGELNAAVEAHKNALEKLKTEAGNASDAYVKNQTAINELNAKIEELTAIYGVHLDTAKQIKKIEGPSTPMGGALTDEGADALKIVHGQTSDVARDSQQLIGDLGALIAGHAVSLQQAAQLIVKADSNRESYMAALDAMNRSADAMRTHSAASLAKFNHITAEIEAHARQIYNLSSRGANARPILM